MTFKEQERETKVVQNMQLLVKSLQIMANCPNCSQEMRAQEEQERDLLK